MINDSGIAAGSRGRLPRLSELGRDGQIFLPKINAALDGVVKYSAKLFSSVEGGVLRLVHKLYYRENGKWIEKTTTREIDESQVPEWAKADLGEEETDVTDRYQEKLELKV